MPTEQFMEYLDGLDELVESNPSLLSTQAFRTEMEEDFRVFCHFAWKEAFGFTPHKIQLDFANLMQESLGTCTVLMALREFGKTIMDATFIDWFLYCDPNRTVLVVSANIGRSKEITGTALAIIKACQFLHHMVPMGSDLDGRMAFKVGNTTVVTKEASCVATSIKAGNTGSHADLILSDDIEIPKNSNTQTKREEIMAGVDEYTYILNGGGTELYIGTPQTEDSVYFKFMKSGEYLMHKVPGEYPDPSDEKNMQYIAQFLLEDLRAGRVEAGDPTYPERFDAETLAKVKAKSPSTYPLQIKLDTTAGDEGRYPLKLKDFIVMDLSPKYAPNRVMWNTANPRDDIDSVGLGKDKFYAPAFVDWSVPREYEHSIMGIDPAGTGPDEVGFCVAKSVIGNVFVTAAGGIDGGYDDATLKKLCMIAAEQGVKELRIEKNWSDGLYAKNLARVMGSMGLRIPITDVTAKGQKEIRIIETLEPAMSSHKVIIDSRVARDQKLMEQITRITRDRGSLVHDDRIDAMEICISGFKDVFLLDTDAMIEKKTSDDFQDEIQGFMGYGQKNIHKGRFLSGDPNRTQKRTFFGRSR